MTQQAENALHKQIKGVTLSLIITILTTFGGAIYMGTKCYINIITAIQNNNKDNENMSKRLDKAEDRLDKHDEKINDLIAKKDK